MSADCVFVDDDDLSNARQGSENWRRVANLFVATGPVVIGLDHSNFGRSLKKDLMACFFFLETILLHLTFLKLLKEFSLWHFS